MKLISRSGIFDELSYNYLSLDIDNEMLNIIVFEIDFEETDKLGLKYGDDGFKNVYKEKIKFSINIKDNFIRRNGVDIFIDGNYVAMPELNFIRDGVQRAGIKRDDKIASLFYLDSEEQVIFISRIPIKTDLDVIVETDSGHDGLIMAKHYPEIRNQANAAQHKYNILQNFDAHSVLAYIEAQLDLLSIVIEKIVNINPDLLSELEKELPIQSIFDAIRTNNVTNVKSIESCLSEINTNKNKLREIQKKYIDTKNGIY